ncbi:hepatic triacylglycerol lipase-like [Schistocerca nitens]|uniref:hepatic triacylglycerol lipase-like n=1 Tax=Schistocerca nitens TaxID=7011 RepID=UPI0021187219|nr:hepatic triacylglycerol lipase-like [Schistocerca nitens]
MLRNAYLSRGGSAVLTVDWSSLAAHRCGRKFAEAQAELVGACTARLLAAGAEAGALPPPERLHALGAGLGAHVAALAAACLPGGHALDPTPAPALRSQEAGGDATPVSAPLLDVEAALQVDVLHTTALAAGVRGVGDPRPAGHVDIYVSCGQPVQPFCHRSSDPGRCSHELAAAYFAEGVWPGPGLRAAPCGDACRRNISLPELPPSEAARLTSYTVPVGEDLPFTASGLLCAEAYSRPPFGRQKGQGGGLFGGGSGHLCWALSGALLLYLLSRALAGRAEEQHN